MNLSKDNSIYPLVIYKGWQCLVRPVLYPDGNPGLVLEDIDDGSPVATCTVNLPIQMIKITEMLEEDFPLLLNDHDNSSNIQFVFIKDYSENEGMLRTLQEAGIVDHPIYGNYGVPNCIYASSGYIEQVPFQYICHNELIEEFGKLYEEQTLNIVESHIGEPDYA